MREDDQFDRVLDAALATYGEPEDESALAGRVLARIAEARIVDRLAARPNRRWLPWAIALPVAASLLLLFFATQKSALAPAGTTKLSHAPQAMPSITARNIPAAPRSEAAVRIKSPRATEQTARPEFAVDSTALPKLNVFPTPRPLTPEERALARIAVRTPMPELQALAKASYDDPLTLSLAAVHIPPLELPDKGEN